MSRNKYPEITVKRILDASLKLFLDKGYERTTIQDIVNALGDLSKGAIYHHFKSKEEIIEAVGEQLYTVTNQEIMDLIGSKEGTGLEKLRKLFWICLENPGQKAFITAAPGYLKNPRFLAQQLFETVNINAPLILPLIEQGVADGSLKTDFPKEVSEASLILLNFWMNPLLFQFSAQELKNKFYFIMELFSNMGIPVLDEKMLDSLEALRVMSEERSSA